MQEKTRAITKALLRLFTELAKSESNQQEIALKADKYAARIVRSGEVEKLPDWLQDIVYGCLDLHHWGKDGEIRPTYSPREIRLIITDLKKRISRDPRQDQNSCGSPACQSGEQRGRDSGRRGPRGQQS